MSSYWANASKCTGFIVKYNKFFHDDQNQRQRNMWNVHHPIIVTERTTESTLLSISCQSRKKQYLGFLVNRESLKIIARNEKTCEEMKV